MKVRTTENVMLNMRRCITEKNNRATNAIAVAEKLGNEEEISRLAMQLQDIEDKRRKVR